MRDGAMIQLAKILKAIWTQIALVLKIWCSDSYRTLQRIGYIMTSRPTANMIQSEVCFDRRYVNVSYGNGYTHELPFLESMAGTRNEVSQEDSDDHGKKYPYCEKSVEKT
jgi:hypothetical protein